MQINRQNDEKNLKDFVSKLNKRKMKSRFIIKKENKNEEKDQIVSVYNNKKEIQKRAVHC